MIEELFISSAGTSAFFASYDNKPSAAAVSSWAVLSQGLKHLSPSLRKQNKHISAQPTLVPSSLLLLY